MPIRGTHGEAVEVNTKPAVRIAKFLLVITFGMVAVAVWYRRSTRFALLDVPAGERRVLYGKTMEAFRELCSNSPGPAFEAKCRDDAALLIQFPECDDACRAWTFGLFAYTDTVGLKSSTRAATLRV